MKNRDDMTEDQRLLCTVRDLLLPGLFSFSQEPYEADIQVDFAAKGLKVMMVKFLGERPWTTEVAFSAKPVPDMPDFTRSEFWIMLSEIRDGSYKETFLPNLEKARRACNE